MPDLVAIDVGAHRIRLCRWDGRQAVAAALPPRHPREAWSDWINLLGAHSAHEIVFRCTHDAWLAECDRDTVRSWSTAAGGRWLRMLRGTPTGDPGLAAARILAGFTRWTTVVSVEMDVDRFRVARQDRRGRIGGFLQTVVRDGATIDIGTLASLVRRLESTSGSEAGDELHIGPMPPGGVSLICIGDRTTEWAAPLADLLGVADRLIPCAAESWPLLGMMAAPIELSFQENCRDATMRAVELRDAFLPLMDAANEAVTREGFDLDDAECSRIVELTSPAQQRPVDFELEALLDAKRLRTQLHRDTAAALIRHHSDGAIEVSHIQSIQVRVVIFPPAPDWPIDIAPRWVKQLS